MSKWLSKKLIFRIMILARSLSLNSSHHIFGNLTTKYFIFSRSSPINAAPTLIKQCKLNQYNDACPWPYSAFLAVWSKLQPQFISRLIEQYHKDESLRFVLQQSGRLLHCRVGSSCWFNLSPAFINSQAHLSAGLSQESEINKMNVAKTRCLERGSCWDCVAFCSMLSIITSEREKLRVS